MPSKKGVKCIDPGSGTNWPLGPTSLWHWQVTLPLSPQFQLWDKGTNNTFLILLDSIGKYSRVFSDILTNTNHWYVLSVKFLCYGKKLGFPPPVLGKNSLLSYYVFRSPEHLLYYSQKHFTPDTLGYQMCGGHFPIPSNCLQHQLGILQLNSIRPRASVRFYGLSLSPRRLPPPMHVRC